MVKKVFLRKTVSAEHDTKLEQNEVIVVDIQGFIDENLLYGKVSIEF